MNKKPIISTAIDVNPTSCSTYEKLLEEQIMKILSMKTGIMSKEGLFEELRNHNICVSQEDINNVISRLKKNGCISNSCTESNIFLNKDKKDEICFKYKKFEETKINVIKNYFTEGITCDSHVVKSWLDKILTTIFEQYYTVVLSRITNQNNIEIQQLDIKSCHSEIARELKIAEEDSKVLLFQLEEMFSSKTDADVNQVFCYYLNTCYASQILSSKTYASLSVADMFRGKTIILDTNILIALQLEKCHQEHVTLAVIEDVCKKLDIKLKYLPQTLSEYKAVLDYKKDVYCEVFPRFSRGVLKMSKEDNISHTLRKKGYYTSEYVKYFFEKYLMVPPQSLVENGTVIMQIPQSDCYSIFEYYSKNEQDIEKLRTVFSSYIPDDFEQDDGDELSEKKIIKKNERVAKHDLGLIGYVRTKRGLGDCAVKYKEKINDDVILLTMDSSLVAYVHSQYPGEDFVYNIRDLITLLALDKGGLLGNPGDFNPMLKNFVNTNFMIWNDTFDIKDLMLIMNLERWVASLDDTKVIQVSRELHKMRMSKSTKSDMHNYLQRELNFEYSTKNKEVNELTDINNEQAQKMKEQNEEIVSLKEQNMQFRLKEFNEKFDKELNKRNYQKRALSVLKVLGIILVIIFTICVVFSFLLRSENIIQYFEKYDGVMRIINFLVEKFGVFVTIDIFSLIIGLIEFFLSKQLELKDYFKIEMIRKEVLEELKVDKELKEYICNGFKN